MKGRKREIKREKEKRNIKKESKIFFFFYYYLSAYTHYLVHVRGIKAITER